MKTLKLFIMAIIMITSYSLTAQVAVTTDGSSADASAMLDVKSTEKGMLIPRISEAEIAAISSPANSLIVFCTTDDKFYAYVLADNEWKEIAFGTGTITPSYYCASCMCILNNDPAAGDGLYWIDPDGEGGDEPFEAYCDMTTDGGGWTLVMNNVSNIGDLNLNSSAGSIPINLSIHGNVELISWMDGSREIMWTVGTDFASLNNILHVQENGTTYTHTGLPMPASTNCPSPALRYDFTVISNDAGWSNTHNTMYHQCTGYPILGSAVSNYCAAGDCGNCFTPTPAFFGNGASGYYSWGDIYDFDYLGWDGQGYFGDDKPSFWTGSNTHQLWVR